VPRVQIITKVGSGTKNKTRHICKDQKQQKIFTGTKTKTRHICRDQNHILAYILFLLYIWSPRKNCVSFVAAHYTTNLKGYILAVKDVDFGGEVAQR